MAELRAIITFLDNLNVVLWSVNHLYGMSAFNLHSDGEAHDRKVSEFLRAQWIRYTSPVQRLR